jgi:hypothetical protein
MNKSNIPCFEEVNNQILSHFGLGKRPCKVCKKDFSPPPYSGCEKMDTCKNCHFLDSLKNPSGSNRV